MYLYIPFITSGEQFGAADHSPGQPEQQPSLSHALKPWSVPAFPLPLPLPLAPNFARGTGQLALPDPNQLEDEAKHVPQHVGDPEEPPPSADAEESHGYTQVRGRGWTECFISLYIVFISVFFVSIIIFVSCSRNSRKSRKCN